MSVANRGWTAERQRELYHRLRAEGRCVRCRGKMLPEWGNVARCPECSDIVAAARRRYYSSDWGKARQRAWRAAAPESFHEGERRRISAMRQQRKLDGICRLCKAPSLEDSVYCGPHRDATRARTRESMRRLRERRRAEARAA